VGDPDHVANHSQACWPVNARFCSTGHADCLCYLLEHGCPLEDDVLMKAVVRGHFNCVKLLVTWEPPQKPLIFRISRLFWEGLPVGPDQLRCLQYVSDQGRPIHTDVLMWVAGSGDVDLVRLLHSRGVGLWAGAFERIPLNETALRPEFTHMWRYQKRALRQQEIIALPKRPEDVAKMWGVLQYGWAMGAPLTPAIEEVFRAKRAATRATLLCFIVAARPSRQLGMSPRQRAALAVMGRMPIEMVAKIILRADFETEHTLYCSRASNCSVKVQIPHPPHEVWMRNDDALIAAFQEWAKDGLPA
jgi:hypothetical protein